MSNPVWLAERTPPFTASPNKVAYCPTYGKWVANGLYDGIKATLIVSTYGFEWTQLVTTVPFVVNGIAGTDTGASAGHIVVITSGTQRIYEMDNAGTWTDRTPVLNGTFSYINYLPGIGFIIVGTRLGNAVNWLSTDGVTWTGPYAMNFTGTAGVSVGATGFVSFNGGGAIAVQYSLNGTAWNTRSLGLGALGNIDGIVYVSTLGKWIGFRSGGTGERYVFQADSDATNWVLVHDFGVGNAFYGINFDPHTSQIIIYGFDTTYVSTDGVTWTDIGQITTGITWSANAAIAGTLVTVTNGTIGTLKSDDFGLTGYYNSGFSVSGGLSEPTNLVLTVNPTDVSFSFDGNNQPAENVDQLVVVRQDGLGNETIVDVINNTGPGPYSGTDNFTVTTPVTYVVFAVSYSGVTISAAATASTVVPDIAVVGSGGIALGGSATIVLQADPSGLYVLTVGKTHDTLYNRLPAGGTVDTAIPNPFFKLGYIGDGND